jgi:hypothetical protein
MFESRGSRFVLEVLFLLCLSAALTLADLSPLEIAGIMLVGWVIVAALEWVSWRNEAHFGSGLPPRYYVPQVNLPPAQPLEQVHAGYPDSQRDEAPTWIASPALRAEVLGEWPVATRSDEEEPEPAEEEAVDPWTVVELPSAPIGEVEEELVEPEPEPEMEPEPEPEPEPVADTFVARIPEPEPVPGTDLAAEPAPEPEPVPELPPVSDTHVSETAPEAPALDVELVRSVQGVARYSLDPLGDPPPRRRFGRGPSEVPPVVEVPARPEGVRALPGRSDRQD